MTGGDLLNSRVDDNRKRLNAVVGLTIHSPDKRAADCWARAVLSQRSFLDSKLSAIKPFCG